MSPKTTPCAFEGGPLHKKRHNMRSLPNRAPMPKYEGAYVKHQPNGLVQYLWEPANKDNPKED